MAGTKLADMYNSGSYPPPSQTEYVNAATYILTHISPSVIVHRLTGDCPRELLIAPEWNGRKSETIYSIVYKMQL